MSIGGLGMQTHAQAFIISVCLYAFLTGEGDKMEIKYKFANGEESYVEVSEEIGAAILESRRKEENLNKKEYYTWKIKKQNQRK